MPKVCQQRAFEFGDSYPVDFLIESTDRTVEISGNDQKHFTTDEVFEGATYIKIIPSKMVHGECRLRIHQITMGIGIYFTDHEIASATKQEYINPVSEELPTVDFRLTVRNNDRQFDIENDESSANFLEVGQTIEALYGQDLPDGTTEWIPGFKLILTDWEVDDDEMSFSAADRFMQLNETYYRGLYREEGITLYDLALDVIQNAGIDMRDIWLDPYLKDVTVNNPMPVVTHKEALQLIANAGRCVLDYDRYGRIRIHSLFRPECETTSNGTTDYSNVSSIDTQTAKTDFATYENNRWLADGKMVFLPKSGIQNTGYVSLAVSDENGLFTENPIITRTLEAKYKAYGIYIEFGKNLPKKFVIRTYSDNVLHDTVTIQSGIAENFELQYDFAEYDKIEIEFVETEPHNRIHVNYISLGSETAYKLEYDDLYSTPVGTQLDKIKNVKVARYLYSKSNVEDDLTSETLVYDGNNAIYYMTDACYG